jgi:tRNA U34 2-thiouridine synthase MnmA/TrmU
MQVAMALLKEQGFKVTAFYLKIWLEAKLNLSAAS